MAGKTQMGMSVSHSETRSGYLLFFEHLDTSLWEMQSRYCYPIFTEEETEALGDRLTIQPTWLVSHGCRIGAPIETHILCPLYDLKRLLRGL